MSQLTLVVCTMYVMDLFMEAYLLPPPLSDRQSANIWVEAYRGIVFSFLDSAKTDNITLWDSGDVIWTLQVIEEEVQAAPRSKIVTTIALRPGGVIMRAGCYSWYQSGTPPVGVVRGRIRQKMVGL
ncbi:hypothetical protein ACLOJK_026753 [Asimina triloba]